MSTLGNACNPYYFREMEHRIDLSYTDDDTLSPWDAESADAVKVSSEHSNNHQKDDMRFGAQASIK